jgi:hypothetical protein
MAEIEMTEQERAALQHLIDLARHVDHAIDDSEEVQEDGLRSHIIQAQDFDDVVEAIDALNDLPDDKPGVTMNPSDKAEWALRRILVRHIATAPAAVAGSSETVKFTDQSTADPVQKARHYLTAMGDQRTNSAYFYDDGYPRRESAQDALATLAVLEQLAAAPTAQPSPAAQEVK